MKTLLVANRGEIAVRIMHAAAELGIRTVAVFSEDDARSLHVRARRRGPPAARRRRRRLSRRRADPRRGQRLRLRRRPSRATASCSENAASRARAAPTPGITFVGPRPETLAIFGDKTRARALAERCGVPVLDGTRRAGRRSRRRGAFLASLGDGGAMVIKAVAGGGGRGMRVVRAADGGRGGLRALPLRGAAGVRQRRPLRRAAHAACPPHRGADRRRRLGPVSHLGERECSIQRRHQKLVEIAPCPSLSPALRARLAADAVRMAAAVRYRNAGTFEFLVDAEPADRPCRRGAGGRAYAFIEANPRLQVEHTVTEEVLGLDLVRIQLQLAAGRSLAELGLEQADVPAPRGFAVQVRINTETMGADGIARPASGTLTAFELPSGHGVRTDTCGYVGYQTNPNFDSLLAKLIGHSTSPRFADAVARTAARARRAATSRACAPTFRSCSGCCGIPTSSPTASTRASSRSTLADAAAALRGDRGRRTPARRRGRSAATRSPSCTTARATAPPSAAAPRAGRRSPSTPLDCAGLDGTRRGALRRCRARSSVIDVARRRRRAARAAAAGHERDEDGARRRGAGRRHRAAASRSRRATRCPRAIRSSSSRSATTPRSRSARSVARGRPRITCAPISPRCSGATPLTLDAARPDAVAAAAQDRPAHGAREHRRPLRCRTRSSSTARSRSRRSGSGARSTT